ncbi:hypothetical protein [Halocatena salina]|uniref:Uncharacterized protein n=1 Tax=Halocatena salina TaxID=2934340 RepID=A0A8U0A7N1_9EURY|nr:hypothetical protein [Halocatena salina]UPM44518.1 hypothetical protein MW046_13880 [Halocatena salina]
MEVDPGHRLGAEGHLVLLAIVGESLRGNRNLRKYPREMIGGLTEPLGVEDDCPR